MDPRKEGLEELIRHASTNVESTWIDTNKLTFHYSILRLAIMKRSEEKKDVQKAFLEWNVISHYKHDDGYGDDSLTRCECTHPIKKCFVIMNSKNGNIYDPIGSECVFRFQNSEMTERVNILSKSTKLYNNVETDFDGMIYDDVYKNKKDPFKSYAAQQKKKKKRDQKLLEYISLSEKLEIEHGEMLRTRKLRNEYDRIYGNMLLKS